MPMGRINMKHLCLAAALVAMSVVACTAETPTASDKPQPATRPAGTRPAGPLQLSEHVRVDLKMRTVVLEAKVATTEGPLEFLLCKEGTKDYESILATKAVPSHVHAAMLLLGLTPGKPVQWIPIGEGESRVLPPRGGRMEIVLEWTDKDGRAHKAPAGQWLTSPDGGKEGEKRTPPSQWVFVGSEMLPGGGYLADSGGEIVSVANFSSSVIDVPFESSDQNESLEFVADSKQIPPEGTKVRVTLHVPAEAAKADHARQLLEIDRWGRLRIDGRPIRPKDLRPWAERYIARHRRGMVVIRAAAEALVHDVESARMELRIGGVFDYEVERLAARGVLPPRTPQEAKAQLADWREQFANPDDYVTDPGVSAAAALEQVRQRKAELEAMRNLLDEYEAHLRQDLAAYQASTRPSGEVEEK